MSANRIDLASLLEARASEFRDRPFLAMTGGVRLSYGEFNERVNQVVSGLADLVGPGERVALMLHNSLEFLLSSYALKKLSAVEVAINTEFRGPGLSRMLNTSEARLLITHNQLLPAITDVQADLRHLRTIVCTDEPPATTQGSLALVPFHDLLVGSGANPKRTALPDTELATILFTSGTSGPAKGCMLSHRYAVRMGEGIVDALGLTRDDCLYCPFPLYHVDAAFLTVVPALLLGARAAIGHRFSVRNFWAEVSDFGATIFDFMGATLTLLHNQEPTRCDGDNPVRIAWGVPMPSFRADFERRFGLRLVHAYGLTDGGMVSYESLEVPEPLGSCGKPRDGEFEVAILDEADDPLPAGHVGEIALRPREPDICMKGYYGMATATLDAFRNLWLHTGDLGRLDKAGHLFFVSRKKDAIRRRGENISAWEIEDVINGHPAVLECAAIGVPSVLTEEDVKVFVCLRPDAQLEAEELREWCATRMARFMVPDSVEIVNSLPKTPTGKVEKYRLAAHPSIANR